MKNKFPDLYRDSQLLVGNAAHQIKNIGTEAYDVVFSNAVVVPPCNCNAIGQAVLKLSLNE